MAWHFTKCKWFKMTSTVMYNCRTAGSCCPCVSSNWRHASTSGHVTWFQPSKSHALMTCPFFCFVLFFPHRGHRGALPNEIQDLLQQGDCSPAVLCIRAVFTVPVGQNTEAVSMLSCPFFCLNHSLFKFSLSVFATDIVFGLSRSWYFQHSPNNKSSTTWIFHRHFLSS